MTATYNLITIQKMMQHHQYYITNTALNDASSVGFDENDIVNCVMQITMNCFYKTMPSITNKALFQDVYRCICQGILLYIKLQINGSAVVISFKEK
jgi:motility quorum-sensing regulator/GCU-specific mRNA interferase toxin